MAALPAQKIFVRKRSQSDGWSQGPTRVWEEAIQGIDRSYQKGRDGSAEMLQTPAATPVPGLALAHREPSVILTGGLGQLN